MSIKGLSLAERTEYILKSDPGHPDNIEAEISKRIAEASAGRKSELPAEKKDAIAASVINDPDFKPTIFYIGNLKRADRIYLGDLTATPTMRDQGITMSSRRVERAIETVMRGLVGWENFLDENGNPIPFERDTAQSAGGGFTAVMSDDAISRLDIAIVFELADAILDANGMRTDLEKNFAGASPLPLDQNSKDGDALNVAKNSA